MSISICHLRKKLPVSWIGQVCAVSLLWYATLGKVLDNKILNILALAMSEMSQKIRNSNKPPSTPTHMLKPVNRLGGVALTRAMQYISLVRIPCRIFSPYCCSMIIMLLYAHLYIMYYQCINFHGNPSIRKWGFALTISTQYIL